MVVVVVVVGKGGHQRIYHGLIREDAKANDVVTLDKPLFVRNMTGLVGSKYFWQ